MHRRKVKFNFFFQIQKRATQLKKLRVYNKNIIKICLYLYLICFFLKSFRIQESFIFSFKIFSFIKKESKI